MTGVSFLTPLDALFALAAVVPLAALWLTRRRAAEVRRALSLRAPGRLAVAPVVVSLALLPALLGIAAAQPVVVRQRQLSQRADAQAYFVFDTSLSMAARSGLHAPSRLQRAKRTALRLAATLGDLPVGVASMTDRTLPSLLPTTDLGLIDRTVLQSIGVDRPPPSQRYSNRATTLQALLPVGSSHFYSTGVEKRILVVFTDGESSRLPPSYAISARGTVVPPFLVHVWGANEHVYLHGRVDKRYRPDPSSARLLQQFAELTHGRVFEESQVGPLAAAIRAAAGSPKAEKTVEQYARVALAPWFVLAGVLPLGFLLWRRNL
jgi:hypothetical protein